MTNSAKSSRHFLTGLPGDNAVENLPPKFIKTLSWGVMDDVALRPCIFHANHCTLFQHLWRWESCPVFAGQRQGKHAAFLGRGSMQRPVLMNVPPLIMDSNKQDQLLLCGKEVFLTDEWHRLGLHADMSMRMTHFHAALRLRLVPYFLYRASYSNTCCL